ncbi:MAG: histidine triad nucleotide-binding protein [Ezakiella sp.]|nr:histidine triad nucleotide-binding protein [Ezakiella sp.]MDD7472003.1 histidine triad nucleotide-binding protein [Bacillota bacterium]MDY3923967.1 histidine triad nucleotide-binding protein [Ezakiella sp.]
MDCLFCKIANKEIESEVLFEDDYCVAFKDINPVAPTHLLVIPKKHIDGIDTINELDKEIVAHIFMIIKLLAKREGLNNGYRVISNVGADGGQSIRHLHFHLIGGKKLGWNFE